MGHGWEPEILTEREILITKGNDMLTDVSMNCAQEILKKQFPCPGLQSTYLGQALRFKEEEENFCQILPNGSLHWIAISNLNCQDGSIIEYFDSLFHGRVKEIISSFKFVIFSIRKPCHQCSFQQDNSVDCGVFSVAFLYYHLSGRDISQVSLDPCKIRQHFLECLTNGIFTDFPESLHDVERSAE